VNYPGKLSEGCTPDVFSWSVRPSFCAPPVTSSFGAHGVGPNQQRLPPSVFSVFATPFLSPSGAKSRCPQVCVKRFVGPGLVSRENEPPTKLPFFSFPDPEQSRYQATGHCFFRTVPPNMGIDLSRRHCWLRCDHPFSMTECLPPISVRFLILRSLGRNSSLFPPLTPLFIRSGASWERKLIIPLRFAARWPPESFWSPCCIEQLVCRAV